VRVKRGSFANVKGGFREDTRVSYSHLVEARGRCNNISDNAIRNLRDLTETSVTVRSTELSCRTMIGISV